MVDLQHHTTLEALHSVVAVPLETQLPKQKLPSLHTQGWIISISIETLKHWVIGNLQMSKLRTQSVWLDLYLGPPCVYQEPQPEL